MQKTDIVTIPYSSALYPKEWKDLSDAPQTLFAIGNTELLKTRKLTVVGSRQTPAAAIKLATEITKDLSKEFTVVTGTADGGDTAAITGALQGNGNVICVLAGGFGALPQSNLPLLEEVAKKGLLLSPHPYETEVRNYSYEYRNKLLALLGEGVFVVGASEKSGALITARYAYRMKKPLFAFPYSPGVMAGRGCNAILKSGGRLTETAVDIYNFFGINLRETVSAPKLSLSADEELLFTALKELGETHISMLSQKSGLPPFKARTLLSSLEVKGLVVGVGGNRYSPV